MFCKRTYVKSCPGNLNVAGLQLSWCDYFANLILQKYYLVIFSLNIMKRRVTARADGQNAVAARLFVLELYYERDSQIDLAETVSAAHKALVNHLAPHLQLGIRISKACQITRSIGNYCGRAYDVPNQQPSSPLHQSLLITSEPIEWEGLAGPGVGCVSEQAIWDIMKNGGNPADITVHEWLHTLEGVIMHGEPLPSPDNSSMHGQFCKASGFGPDGQPTWYDWYSYLLRP